MTSILVAMIMVLLLAVGIVGLVLVGIEGRGKRRAPEDRPADRPGPLSTSTVTAQPPARLVKLIESTLHR